MKNLTAKYYTELHDQKKKAHYTKRKAMDLALSEINPAQNWEIVHAAKAEIKELEKKLSGFQKVFLSFYVGSRGYTKEVVKIGKSYFSGSDKMTKGRGFYIVEEVAEISQKAKDEMLADSYYY